MPPNKNYPAWIILTFALGLALALIFYANHSFYQEFLATSSTYGTTGLPKRPAGAKATVKIDFGNNRIRNFESELPASYGIETALGAVAQAGHFTFSISAGKIHSVAGIRGVWAVYKNDLPVENLSGLLISSGDRYLLQLKK